MEQPRRLASRRQEWFGTPAATRATLPWPLACIALAVVTGVAVFFLVRGALEIGNA